jgi:sulfate adenylyltransferase
VAGAPHGGTLVNLFVDSEEDKADLIAGCDTKLELTERQMCDVELLSIGGFSTLRGFMTEEVYDHVLDEMRLPEQQLWGLPVVLDVQDSSAYAEGEDVLLSYNGEDLAVLHVESIFSPDKAREAKAAFGTSELEHPGVAELATVRRGRFCQSAGVRARCFDCGIPVRRVFLVTPIERARGGGRRRSSAAPTWVVRSPHSSARRASTTTTRRRRSGRPYRRASP